MATLPHDLGHIDLEDPQAAMQVPIIRELRAWYDRFLHKEFWLGEASECFSFEIPQRARYDVLLFSAHIAVTAAYYGKRFPNTAVLDLAHHCHMFCAQRIHQRDISTTVVRVAALALFRHYELLTFEWCLTSPVTLDMTPNIMTIQLDDGNPMLACSKWEIVRQEITFDLIYDTPPQFRVSVHGTPARSWSDVDNVNVMTSLLLEILYMVHDRAIQELQWIEIFHKVSAWRSSLPLDFDHSQTLDPAGGLFMENISYYRFCHYTAFIYFYTAILLLCINVPSEDCMARIVGYLQSLSRGIITYTIAINYALSMLISTAFTSRSSAVFKNAYGPVFFAAMFVRATYHRQQICDKLIANATSACWPREPINFLIERLDKIWYGS